MPPRLAESDNKCLRTDEKREYIITYGAHGTGLQVIHT
jgi:hypothetical protein